MNKEIKVFCCLSVLMVAKKPSQWPFVYCSSFVLNRYLLVIKKKKIIIIMSSNKENCSMLSMSAAVAYLAAVRKTILLVPDLIPG